MTFDYLRKFNHVVDREDIDGIMWELYEDNEFGDAIEGIATNGNIFVYTWECLAYTVENLNNEYEVHHFE